MDITIPTALKALFAGGSVMKSITSLWNKSKGDSRALIADLTQWCSSDEEFTNRYATSDESAGSCWSGAADKNKTDAEIQFCFTADPEIMAVLYDSQQLLTEGFPENLGVVEYDRTSPQSLKDTGFPYLGKSQPPRIVAKEFAFQEPRFKLP